jgi:ATP-dependent Clp protease ATP-binding subunit ClpA
MMFERFTAAARGVVVEAQTQARVLAHSEILAEHLLLGVLADSTSLGAGALRDLGLDQDALAREVATLGAADEDALRAIGIDLAIVRQRVEEAFGPGALDQPRPKRAGLRRRVVSVSRLPFTDPAKQALTQSLHQAVALRHGYIGTDHLLLGLLADDQTPAARTLARLGVDPAVVRTRVRDALRRAA